MMQRHGFRVMLIASVALGSVFASSWVQAEQAQFEWQFDQRGDLQGWTVGGHIQDAQVSAGALSGETSDWDPILISPVFQLNPSPTQYVEIKICTPQGGAGQFFWTQTLEGKNGGFSQAKSHSYATDSKDEFQTVRIYPFWHAVDRIVRLRVDPPATGRFAIDSIRVVESDGLVSSDAKAWRFESQAQGWRAWQDLSQPTIRQSRLHVQPKGNSPILISPLISVSAAENPFVAIRMSVDKGSSGRVFCVSNTQFGWEDVSFPLRADGQVHSYNVDVGHIAQWRDQIIMLGIQPTDQAGAEVAIESIEIADGPRGPVEFAIDYFGSTEGVNRVDRPSEISLAVQNLGGDTARGTRVVLTAPEGVQIVGSDTRTIDTLTHWLPRKVTWHVRASRALRATLTAKVENSDAETVVSSTEIEFTPVPTVAETAYIPKPIPVPSPYEIGTFYFPGWPTMSRWRPILDYPNRKPVLGWYDESNPECADWQIKWAVEHGISFFMVDWYWCQGKRHLEHWLHDAYMQARFRKYLKWCVMWANHNPAGTHSIEDWRQVTQYWIDHYFGMDEYYRIDGRPAVFIWAPGNIRNDVGGSEQAAKLYELSQEMAREAGLPGIYFVAMSSHQSQAASRQLKTEGYEACTSYHGFQLAAQRAGSKRFPFSDVVDTGPEVWREADQRASDLLYMPIVDTGWSSEPWHGNKSLVITDRTPTQFGRLCRAARDYAQQTDKKIITVGPCNEWGEGSYIEPYAEYGFQDLDQLRKAFCPPGSWPPNLIPADVGRGPYDLPQQTLQTEWHFNRDGDFQGWTANGYLSAKVEDGQLVGETKGSDPMLHGPKIEIEAARTKCLTIRMRSDTAGHAQLFWSTATASQGEGNSHRFRVFGDGRFHDYRLDLSQAPQWRGLITSLRFDPLAKSKVEFAVDFIRFE